MSFPASALANSTMPVLSETEIKARFGERVDMFFYSVTKSASVTKSNDDSNLLPVPIESNLKFSGIIRIPLHY